MLMEKCEMNQLFSEFCFIKAKDGAYDTDWYPLLGLSGSMETKEGSVLFCRLQAEAERKIQSQCLNGVINKLRIHKSARVNGPDTMLVPASDLIREFEVCQVPLMSDAQVAAFTEEARG